MIEIPNAGAGESVPATGIALPDQVATYLLLTENRLPRMRSEGQGPPYIKLGKSIRYRWEDVHRYVEENLQNAPEETSVPTEIPSPDAGQGLPSLDVGKGVK